MHLPHKTTLQCPKVFREWCGFRLRSVLHATTACNFWPLLRSNGSTPAALASLYFSTFRSHETMENTVFRDLSTFSRTLIFLSCFSDRLSSASLFSDSSYLCFSICLYCRKFDFQTSFDDSLPVLERISKHTAPHSYCNILMESSMRYGC